MSINGKIINIRIINRWPSEVHLESSLDDDMKEAERQEREKEKEQLFDDEPVENVTDVTWVTGIS